MTTTTRTRWASSFLFTLGLTATPISVLGQAPETAPAAKPAPPQAQAPAGGQQAPAAAQAPKPAPPVPTAEAAPPAAPPPATTSTTTPAATPATPAQPAAAAQPAPPPASAQPAAAPAAAAAPVQPAPAGTAPTAAQETPAQQQQARARWRARVRMAQARRAAQQPPEQDLPPPEEPWLHFGIGGLARIHLDKAFDLFSEDDVVAGPELFVSIDVLDLSDSLVLAGELGYAYHSSEAQGLRGGLFSTRIVDHRPHAGFNLRLKALPYLQPYARLLVGIDAVRTEIEIPNEGFLAENEETNVFGRMGLGFTVRFPPGQLRTRSLPNATIGLRGEFGYTLTSSVPLKLEDPPEGDNPIPIHFADLGELRLSDPYFLISLVAAI